VVLRRVIVVAAVAAFAATAACSSGAGKAQVAGGTAGSTAPTTAAPPTTSTTIGVDQIPPVITVEYAQRVMNALDKAFGDMTRLIYANKVPTADWHDHLVALLDKQAFADAETEFGRDAADAFDTYRSPPGNPATQVKGVYDSTPTCIALDVSRDFGPLFTEAPSQDLLSALVFLRPKTRERDPRDLNPTAWIITADGQPNPGVALENICH
jgi:hypothetical protein